MTSQLPRRPNLKPLRNQAKQLVRDHRRGDPRAAGRIRASLPRLAGATEEEILSAPFALTEAQHVVAREYGFPNWRQLSSYTRAAAAREGRKLPDDVEASTDAALTHTVGLTSGDDPLRREPVDVKISTDDVEVRVNEVVELRLWATPEERETSDEIYRNIYISAHRKDAAYIRAEEGRWNATGSTLDRVGDLHEEFVLRLAPVLTRALGIEVETIPLGTSHVDSLDFGGSAEPVCAYRFHLLPDGPPAAIRMPFALGRSFLDRRPDGGALSPAEQQRLDRLVQLMLDELRRSWGLAVAPSHAAPSPCDSPRQIQIAEYGEQGVGSTFAVKSERAFQLVQLFYPRATIERIKAQAGK